MNLHVTGDGLLASTVRQACSDRRHTLTSDAPEIQWVCWDTPVENDVPDASWVCDRIAEDLPEPGVPVLISSQVPVGTCARLEQAHPEHTFAVNPENIRRSNPYLDFCYPGRHIVGARTFIPAVEKLLGEWTTRVLWMSPESAEMGKHALNAYLAASIAFANEIADLCGQVGADPDDVERVLRSDKRVGWKLPLVHGGPFTGGTLGRDLHVLDVLGAGPLIRSISESNRERL